MIFYSNNSILKRIPSRLLPLLFCFWIPLLLSDPVQAESCNSSDINRFKQEIFKENPSDRYLTESIKCFEAVKYSVEVLKTSKKEVSRSNAAYIIASANSNDLKNILDDLLSILAKSRKKEKDARIRYWIIIALGNAQEPQPKVISALIDILKNDIDGENRGVAALSLGNLKANSEIILPVLLQVFQVTHPNKKEDIYEKVAIAISSFSNEIAALKTEERQAYLKTLETLVQSTNYSIPVRLAIGSTFAKIASSMTDSISTKTESIQENWTRYNQISQVSKELETIVQALKAPELAVSQKEVERYKELVDSRQRDLILGVAQWWFSGFGQLFAIHALFWLTLIFLYPRSPMVQTVFFWDSRVRKIFGFPYVTSALKWIPPLRRILFIPFKEPLQSDANLDLLKHQIYFADLQVKADGWKESQPISMIIPQLKGQIVLQGESGSGKSMFLRHLLNQSKQLAVYLPAQKCNEGVIAAIQTKLYGQAQDKDFLRDLIYSGAIDIYIDGLNEVNPDTRANIKEFVEKNFKSNILLSTQPLEWKPPGKVYNLQPLEIKQSQDFLEQHQPILSNSQMEHKSTKIDNYKKNCEDYLKAIELELNSDKVPSDERLALSQILSNPMELTVVAQLIANGKKPNLLYLREQQYETMDVDYKQKNQGRPFPLDSFAEMTYKLRLNSQSLIPYEDFTNEIPRLEDHKMVVRREKLGEDGKPQTQWFFRHEKIADFFIAHSFLKATDDRQVQHFADSRFRGVYLLLATLLPESKKMLLREQLIQYAAKQNDHMLSDAFVQLVGTPKFADPQQS